MKWVSASRMAIGERGGSRKGGGSSPTPRTHLRTRDGTVGIRWNPWQSVVIRGNPWQSVAIRGHQWSSVAIRGNPWQSVVITHLELEMVPLDLLVEREGLCAAQVLHLRLHGLAQLLTRALVPEQVRPRVVFPDGTPEHCPIEWRRRLSAHLMREAIKRSSVVIAQFSGTAASARTVTPSDAIRRHQTQPGPSKAIETAVTARAWTPSDAIRCNQTPSDAIRRHQRPSRPPSRRAPCACAARTPPRHSSSESPCPHPTSWLWAVPWLPLRAGAR